MKHIVTLSKPVDLSGIKQFLLIHITFLTKEGIQSCISKWCTEASRWTSLLNQLHTQKVHELKVQFAAALHFFQAHQCNNYSWISHNLAMHKKSFKDAWKYPVIPDHANTKNCKKKSYSSFCNWKTSLGGNIFPTVLLILLSEPVASLGAHLHHN